MSRPGPRGQSHGPAATPTPKYVAQQPADRLKQSIERNTSIKFFREAWDELAKVHWPSRQETINLVGLVIATSIVVGICLGALDFFFAWIVNHLIGAS